MADINALYEELTKFYFYKGTSAQLNGPVGAWRALEASEFFVPGGGGLRFLLDFARSEECRDFINSDEVLARVVKQLDAAVEEISAVRDIAVCVCSKRVLFLKTLPFLKSFPQNWN